MLVMCISSFRRIYRFIYYCDMTNPLPNLLSNQIIIENNSKFYYTIKPYELSNALGNRIAVLQEYDFMKRDDSREQPFVKLYKTTEGNWYDIEDIKPVSEKKILRLLKSAIDAKENKISLSGSL